MRDIAQQLGAAVGDRYRVERELGRGGMAVVYLADDLKHGRRVAIKVLDPALAETVAADRFLREMEVAARLSHPRIVPLLDSGAASSLIYYVMPYVEGESLRERLEREGQLSIEDAVSIVRQAAAALAYAHDRGIVHRDVKPENILLSGHEAVVTDFGIAHALTEAGGTRLTRSGVAVGTPLYMSPEQASGRDKVDARSDVYSLGCILHEMLAGEPPFSGRTAQAVTARKLSESAPDLRMVRESVPVSVAAVVRKALARLPADRYRSAAELAEALKRTEEPGAGDLQVSEQNLVPRRVSTWWRRAAVGLGVALLGVSAHRVVGWTDGRRDLGTGLFVEIGIDGRVELGAELALAPDGRRLAYVSGDRLWVRDLPGMEAREIPGSEGARIPFWSHDGSEVGYAARGWLWRASAAGGESVAVAGLGVGLSGGAGATWSEDGDIVFATGFAPLMSVPARGGVPRVHVPLEPGELDHHEPHALPGNRGILFIPHGEGPADAIVLFAGGERRELLRLDDRSIRHPSYSSTGHIFFEAAGGIWGAPFSLRRLDVTGDPFLVRPGAWTPAIGGGALAFRMEPPGIPGPFQLALVNRSGEIEDRVGEPGRANFFRVAPDGRRVAASRRPELHLWILDLARGTRSRITSAEEVGIAHDWSPDGAWIAYWGGSPDPHPPGIRIRAADGTGGPRDLLRGWYPSFAPYGGRLTVSLGLAEPDDDWHIGYLDLESDGDVVPIVATSARNCCQQVSPDGRYLAYVSDISGRWEVYLTRFPTGEGTWRVSDAGGIWPRWDRRGDRLYYAQELDIMEVRVATSPDLEIGSPQQLFRRPARVTDLRYGMPDYFDVAPDGERFLVMLPATEGALSRTGVVVVGNWRDLQDR